MGERRKRTFKPLSSFLCPVHKSGCCLHNQLSGATQICDLFLGIAEEALQAVQKSEVVGP